MRPPSPGLWRLLAVFALPLLLAVSLPGGALGAPATASSASPSATASSAASAFGALPNVSVPQLPNGDVSYRPAASALPSFQWAVAFIYYGPGDDLTHFMGEGAAMVSNDATRNITTFGGEGVGGLINYTVGYNYSTGEFWVNVPSPTPSPRTNASFADVRGRNVAVLFGGLTDLKSQATSSETWVYNFTNDTWRNVTQAVAPPARESAAFAVNVSGNYALLEGGYTPSYNVSGSSASVFWNDTWSLNLTTFRWTQLHPKHAPPPMFGSGMVWQNATDRFDLFGGCSLTCSSTLWTYGGAVPDWHAVPVSGGPSARAASAFQWDAAQDSALLVGGFDWGAGGPVALGDQWVYLPATNAWHALNIGAGPGPIFDVANTWSDFPGCDGMTLIGGNQALAGPPTQASLLEPFIANSTNCFPNLISGGSGPPPPPCAGNHSSLVLRVLDNATGDPIDNASVTLGGVCIATTRLTDAEGYVNLTVPAPGQTNITVAATGYHNNRTVVFFVPNATMVVNISLVPNPSLHILAWNQSYGKPLTPLSGVLVQEGKYLDLGTTGPSGWLNISNLNQPPGNLTLYGVLANHSTASTVVEIPSSGPVLATLVLEAAGPLDVWVIDNSSGTGIGGVAGTLTDTDRGAGRPVTFTTDAAGWYNFSALAAANFTLTAAVFGYYSNQTSFDHAWMVPQTIVVRLLPKIGATLDAYVLDGYRLVPLPGATVTFLDGPRNVTAPSGWANFTDLKPPGTYEVEVNATGYVANYSYVAIDWGKVIDPYVVKLSPITPCPDPRDPLCPPATSAAAPPAFGYLNGDHGVLPLLIALPAVLLAGGLLIAWAGSRRTEPPVRGRPPNRAPGGP